MTERKDFKCKKLSSDAYKRDKLSGDAYEKIRKEKFEKEQKVINSTPTLYHVFPVNVKPTSEVKTGASSSNEKGKNRFVLKN